MPTTTWEGAVPTMMRPPSRVELDEFITMMDRDGIDHGVIFPLYDRYGDYNPHNDKVRRAFAARPRRFTGLFRVDPYLGQQTLDDVEDALRDELDEQG